MTLKLEMKDILKGNSNEESKKFIEELNKNQEFALLDIFNTEYDKVAKVMDVLVNYYSITPYFDLEFTDVDRVSIAKIGFNIIRKHLTIGMEEENKNLFMPVLNPLFDETYYGGDTYVVYTRYDILVKKDIYDIIMNQSSLDEKYKENLMNLDNDFYRFLNDSYYKYLDEMVEIFGQNFFRDNIKFIPVINFDYEGKFNLLGARLICINSLDEALSYFSDTLGLDWTPFEDEVTQVIYSV